MLLPCSEESTMMVFDEVYADIGDEQSISQNLFNVFISFKKCY